MPSGAVEELGHDFDDVSRQDVYRAADADSDEDELEELRASLCRTALVCSRSFILLYHKGLWFLLFWVYAAVHSVPQQGFC